MSFGFANPDHMSQPEQLQLRMSHSSPLLSPEFSVYNATSTKIVRTPLSNFKQIRTVFGFDIRYRFRIANRQELWTIISMRVQNILSTII